MSMDQPADHEPHMPDLPSVEDEGDISERRALQRVQDLWDFVTETRTAIARDNLVDSATPEQRRRAYYDAVRSLWVGLKPYLSTIDDKVEKEYLLNVDLGTVQLDPPRALTEDAPREQRVRLLPGESYPTAETYSFDGFLDFEQADVVLQARWAVKIDADSFRSNNHRAELNERIQRSQFDTESRIDVHDRDGSDFEEPFLIQKTKLLPRHVIESAFKAEVELMGELGMSTKHEEETEGTMKDKYKEIMGGVE